MRIFTLVQRGFLQPKVCPVVYLCHCDQEHALNVLWCALKLPHYTFPPSLTFPQ